MILNLKFKYRDLTTEDLEILLQDMQGASGGKIYSITKIKGENCTTKFNDNLELACIYQEDDNCTKQEVSD